MFSKNKSRKIPTFWPQTRINQIVNVFLFGGMAFSAWKLSRDHFGNALLAVAILLSSFAVCSLVFLLKHRLLQSSTLDLSEQNRKLLRLAGLLLPTLLVCGATLYAFCAAPPLICSPPPFQNYPSGIVYYPPQDPNNYIPVPFHLKAESGVPFQYDRPFDKMRQIASAAHEVKIADAYFANKDYDQAIAHYDIALQNVVDDEHSLKNIAASYFIKHPDQRAKSLEYAENARMEGEKSLAVDYMIAESLVDLARYEDAFSTVDSITSKYPDFVPGWKILDRTYRGLHLEHYDTAKLAASKCAQYGEHNEAPEAVLSALLHQ